VIESSRGEKSAPTRFFRSLNQTQQAAAAAIVEAV